VLIVEDEPYMAEAIRDGLRLEAIAADIAGDGDIALALLSVNDYDIAVLDRDIPGPSGDEIAKCIVASGSGMPILMLTAADRLDDKASGFGLGADDYLTKPFALQELVLRLRALDRRRANNRPPMREIAGTDHTGVGLGLAIVKRITQAHDGSLTLTPRASGGLCVTVQLPVASRMLENDNRCQLGGYG
jgi:DNA-binding response OmpR family regulator